MKTLAVLLLLASSALAQESIITSQVATVSSTSVTQELGNRFTTSAPGQITALKFYKESGDAVTHIGHVWNASGMQLASATFTGETDSGWQIAVLNTPLIVMSAAALSVSVNASGKFAVGLNAFPITSAHLTATSGSYGVTGAYPSSASPHNYFRDVVFVAYPSPAIVSLAAPIEGQTITSSSNIAVSGTVGGLSPGSYSVSLTAKDALGQVSTSSANVVVPRLLQQSDLVYQGAFRLPQGIIGASAFSYGGTALAYNPARNSLFMVGHDQQQLVAEVSIPTIGTGAIATLQTATLLQPFADITEGKKQSVGSSTDQVKVGGLLPYNGKLIASVYVYYDGNGTQVLSHFVSGSDLSVQGDVTGPFQVGMIGAGDVSGYMTNVPPSWQAALGGPVLLGNCCLSIISRTSYGPAVFAADVSQLGTTPLAITPLLYYNAAHPLGPWSGDSLLFNGSTNVTGVIFPTNARSILFFGKQGVGPACYGDGTANQALAGTQSEPGAIFCYDPTDSSKGFHGFPYAYYVWAYDAWDLVAVKQGAKQPYDLRPYAVWTLTLPYPGGTSIKGATYDPATGRVFVTQQYGDGDRPLVHVFVVKQ